MAGNSSGGLFRPRNVIGAALIAGIGLGIYLGPLFKGFGLGGGKTPGTSGQDSKVQANLHADGQQTTSTSESASSNESGEPATSVVKVLIDDRSYFLRRQDDDVPIELSQLIKQVKRATGDPDGFKIRIYEKTSARVSAEEALKEALSSAGIPDTAVLWVPVPVK